MKLQYLNKIKEIDIYLDKDIKIIKEFAKEVIREVESFENDRHIIKLIYRGKILDDNLKLGNYIKDNDSICFQKFNSK